MNYLLTSKTFRQSLAISIMLVMVLIQLPSMRQNTVRAFMPTNARAFLLTLRTSNWTHQSMTRSAIKELDAEFFSITKLTNSMKKAIEQIADSDALISGSFVTSVSAQSALTESECVRKAELQRQFLTDIALRGNRSALMRASLTGKTQTVRALLRRGVAVNQKNAIGMTPLMLAAGAGHMEVIKALLAAGADPNAAGGVAHGPIFSVMTMGMTSSNKHRMEVVDTLIAAGGKVNPPRDSPIAPLVYAIASCDVDMIQALLAKGADVNWNRGAPLVAAVTNFQPEVEIVKVLLAAGADPNLPRVSVGDVQMTLLSYWEERTKSSRGDGEKRDDRQEEIVRLLKDAGAKTLP